MQIAYSRSEAFADATSAGTQLWGTNFQHAQGTSQDAFLDGPSGSRNLGDHPACTLTQWQAIAEVVGAANVDASLPYNALSVERVGGNCIGLEVDFLGRGLLTLGQSFFLRAFIRTTTTASPHNHPFNLNHNGDIQCIIWQSRHDGASAGFYRPSLVLADFTYPNSSPEDLGWAAQDGVLQAGPSAPGYRFEWWVHDIVLNTPSAGNALFRVNPRVYTMGGTLILDATTMRRRNGWGGSPTQSLQQFYDAGNYHRATDQSLLYRFVPAGHEGATGPENQPWYVTGLAMAQNDWVGSTVQSWI